MSYGYSATTNTFYVMEDRADYAAFGNWPEDVKPISDAVWERFCVQGPEGKMRGADKHGLPCWVDIPPPTREQLVAASERKKARLMADATQAIAPLQDAEDLDMATQEEKAQRLAWKRYRVLLSRINPEEAPTIAWPQPPA
ncbi:tail fiber assembly protein [Serratia marcescens]|uniref:tail fiber assembly protein n=1 Tax=Serratia marcescens TaxID=615 RepID=UPI003D176519